MFEIEQFGRLNCLLMINFVFDIALFMYKKWIGNKMINNDWYAKKKKQPTNPTKYTTIYIRKVKSATVVEGIQKAPFSIATTPRCSGGRYSFPGLLHFTLDNYLILPSVKQAGIKYHF